MGPYFKRVDATGGKLFNGGISWSNTVGNIMASSSGTTANISDREYFQQTLATRRPYVSGGLIGKQSRKPVVVVAIPTFDAAGRLTGVLTGGIRLGSFGKSGQTEELGLSGLTVVDRNGQLILQQGLGHSLEHGASVSHAGCKGRHHQRNRGSRRAVAVTSSHSRRQRCRTGRSPSTSPSPRSMPAPGTRSSSISRPSASPSWSCSRSSALAVRRSGRQIREQGQQAQSWTRLTRTLAAASTPAEVADAMLETVQEVFPDAVIVVSVHSETGDELRAASSLPGWRRVPGDDERFAAIADLIHDGPRSWSLERQRSLRDLYLAFGRGLKALHGVPIPDPAGRPAGGIGLLTERSRLAPSEWELLGAFAAQAAQPLERARAFEHEHEVAVRLQQSLLPSELPTAPGLEPRRATTPPAAPESRSAATGTTPSSARTGSIMLCVGDVSGRGVGGRDA